MSTAEMINHELAARWEMCCEAVGTDTDATAAEWREAYEAKRAQVQREAKVQALREVADAALAVREAHCKIWPWPGSPEWSEAAHEYELTRVAFEQLKESPWGWVMDRADKLEGENE